MSELRLSAESPAELVFTGHNPIGAVVAATAAAAVVVIAGRSDGVAAATAQLLGGFLAVACGVAAFFRDSLRIDLVRGRWLRTRGYGPFARKTERELATITRVEVVEERGLHRGRPSVEWEVWLRASDAAAEVRVLEVREEARARELQARLARALRK